MSATMIKKCKCCGSEFIVRVADHKRGWGKFCSKSCKAIKQTQSGGGQSRYPRHDGVSDMAHKWCEQCERKAVNGLYELDGRIHWYCMDHMAENSAHPFLSDVIQS